MLSGKTLEQWLKYNIIPTPSTPRHLFESKVISLTKHQAELVLGLIFLGAGDALLEAECLVNSLLNVNVLLLLLLLGLAPIILALILAVHCCTGHVQRRFC
jgi:hypothetical protein